MKKVKGFIARMKAARFGREMMIGIVLGAGAFAAGSVMGILIAV